jgi:hypothetical protein
VGDSTRRRPLPRRRGSKRGGGCRPRKHTPATPVLPARHKATAGLHLLPCRLQPQSIVRRPTLLRPTSRRVPIEVVRNCKVGANSGGRGARGPTRACIPGAIDADAADEFVGAAYGDVSRVVENTSLPGHSLEWATERPADRSQDPSLTCALHPPVLGPPDYPKDLPHLRSTSSRRSQVAAASTPWSQAPHRTIRRAV